MSKKVEPTAASEPAAPETPTPPAAPPETDAEPLIKSGFKKVRVADMRGSFGTAKFDDNCEAEVNEDTLTLLHKHFPNAEVEFLD